MAGTNSNTSFQYFTPCGKLLCESEKPLETSQLLKRFFMVCTGCKAEKSLNLNASYIGNITDFIAICKGTFQPNVPDQLDIQNQSLSLSKEV